MTNFLILDANVPDKTKVVLNTENIDIEQRKEGGFLIKSGSGRDYSANTDYEVHQVYKILGKDIVESLDLKWPWDENGKLIEKEENNG